MTLSQAEMDRKMDEHFQYEALDDIRGVLATLRPDEIHDIVGWPTGAVQGREKVKLFYETMFADLADGKAACIKRLYGDGFLIDESLWEGRAPGRPFGLE